MQTYKLKKFLTAVKKNMETPSVEVSVSSGIMYLKAVMVDGTLASIKIADNLPRKAFHGNVSLNKLLNVTRKFKDKNAIYKLKDGKLHVSGGNTTVSLNLESHEHTIRELSIGKDVGYLDYYEGFKSAYAHAMNYTRDDKNDRTFATPFISDDGTIIGTNGFILIEIKSQDDMYILDNPLEKNGGLMLSKSFSNLLLELGKESDEIVIQKMNDDNYSYYNDGVVSMSGKISYLKFPHYKKLVESKFEKKNRTFLELPTKDILDAIDMASIVHSTDDVRKIAVFELKDGILTIQGQSDEFFKTDGQYGDSSTAHLESPVMDKTANFRVGLNTQMFKKHFGKNTINPKDTDTITFSAVDEYEAVFIENGNIRILQMPIEI